MDQARDSMSYENEDNQSSKASKEEEKKKYKHLYKRSMTVPDKVEMEMGNMNDEEDSADNDAENPNDSNSSIETNSKKHKKKSTVIFDNNTTKNCDGNNDNNPKQRQARGYSLSVDESNLRSFRQTFDGTKEFDFIMDALNSRLDIFASQSLNVFHRKKKIAGMTDGNEQLLLTTEDSQVKQMEYLDETAEEDATTGSKTSSHVGTCSNTETMFNTFNYMMGPVVLTYPYSMVQGGYSLSFIIIFVNISAFFTAWLMNKICSHYSNITQFSELVEITIGKKAERVAAFILIVELYFYVILFLIFSGDLLYNSGYLELFKIDGYINSTYAIVVMFCLIGPTYYLNNLKPLSKMSTVSIISVICAYTLVFVETGIRHAEHKTDTSGLSFFTNIVGFGYGLGACFGPYSLHPVIPNMRQGMKTPDSYLRIMLTVWCVILIFQLSVGLCGYFTYGNEVSQSVTSNFSTYFGYIASILLLFKAYSVPALYMYPLVILFLKWLQVQKYKKLLHGNNAINSENTTKLSDYKNLPKWYEISFRTFLGFAALGFAMILGDFSLMANIVGALCASALSILFPSAMYIGFIKLQRKKGKAYAFKKKETIICILCIAVIVVSFILCV